MTYFYRTHTATLSGSVEKTERCFACSSTFCYEVRRTVAGGGHSPFGLTDAGAAAAAERRARDKLRITLEDAIEPVPCPVCGVFQPHMIAEIRRVVRSKDYDPNSFARERISEPIQTAWRRALAANNIEAYQAFAQVWPTHAHFAKAQIRELRFPVARKLLSYLFRVLWGAVALAAIVLSTLAFVGPHLH
jgi:hypothetical protein